MIRLATPKLSPAHNRMSLLMSLLTVLLLCLPAHAASRPRAHSSAHAASHSARGSVRTASRHSRTPAVRERGSSARGRVKSASATRLVRGRHGRVVRVAAAPAKVHYAERFYASSFADNLTAGDVTAGEDPIVRAAAIEALGNMNGTAMAIDPATGRVLAMVNQKLALSSGAEPCSTIKLTVALAALQEGIVKHDTPVALGGGYHLTLTEALAHSNNLYFETLGRALGFERVKHYANQLGPG